MNPDLAEYILQNGPELYNYLKLRAYYVLNCELGSELEIDVNQFGGEEYLRMLKDSGLVSFSQPNKVKLYDDGWLGFKKQKQVQNKDSFIGKADTFLRELCGIAGKPPDYYRNNTFNTKYPTLLSNLRKKHTDEEILEVVKRSQLPLQHILLPRVFEEWFNKKDTTAKDREEEKYTASW